MNNFYPLPEWHTQGATVLVWPHRYTDWSSTLESISTTYLELTRIISDRQAVLIVHYDHEHKELIKDECSKYHCNLQHIEFVQIETNDTWVRDYGPQILLGNQEFQFLDMEFNAWGEQYAYRLDNLFAETFYKTIVDKSKCEYHRTPFVIEGGNVDFNSHAALLTNIECIKRNNSKLKLATEDIKEKLKQQFSVKRILDLEVPPLDGDDTGGHIDTLARFVNDNTIVFAANSNTDDPNYFCLEILRKQLESLRQRYSGSYRLIPILMPSTPMVDEHQNFLPASYINFVFINGALLVPLYNDKNDALAIKTFKQACPNHEILGMDASELLRQFGSLHCATLNIPEKVIDENRLSPTK